MAHITYYIGRVLQYTPLYLTISVRINYARSVLTFYYLLDELLYNNLSSEGNILQQRVFTFGIWGFVCDFLQTFNESRKCKNCWSDLIFQFGAFCNEVVNCRMKTLNVSIRDFVAAVLTSTLQSSRILWVSSARLLLSCIDLRHSSSSLDLSITASTNYLGWGSCLVCIWRIGNLQLSKLHSSAREIFI